MTCDVWSFALKSVLCICQFVGTAAAFPSSLHHAPQFAPQLPDDNSAPSSGVSSFGAFTFEPLTTSGSDSDSIFSEPLTAAGAGSDTLGADIGASSPCIFLSTSICACRFVSCACSVSLSADSRWFARTSSALCLALSSSSIFEASFSLSPAANAVDVYSPWNFLAKRLHIDTHG